MPTDPRIACFIPVRMESERLPGKCLADLKGNPVLYHLVQRVLACKYIRGPRDIIVCTTQKRTDDALDVFCGKHGLRCFRGSEDDIVKRFHDAAVEYDIDLILESDGDDPLCDPSSMDRVLDYLIGHPGTGFVGVRGLALGLAPRAFTRDALAVLVERKGREQMDTGYELLFTETGWVNSVLIKGEPRKGASSPARFTMDYPEDLAFLRAVMDELYEPGSVFGAEDLEKLLKEKPELMDINRKLNEVYWQRWRRKAGRLVRKKG
ncbi:MAG: hypothetical protein JXQ75_14045 [Phycisphaerae bacterium]|nr:hypothetical protein [Phycisphaerae bacterium]